MEWWSIITLIWCGFIFFLLIGIPVAFAFLIVNLIALYLFVGSAGLWQLPSSMWVSVGTFSMLPVPLFILMGELMFLSGVGSRMMDVLDLWIGHVPGRLSILAVVGGVIFATLSGSSLAGTAMLGSTLVPEMEKRGYKKAMTLGPIMGGGCLSPMIPPSALGVILATLAMISVAKVLIAIIIPGLLMASLYSAYIIIRCILQPSIAPPYRVALPPVHKRIKPTVLYILPLMLIIFLVIGVMFVGLATPSEAASMGCIGTFAVAAFFKKLNWKVIKGTMTSTLEVGGMVFLIITGATAYSQILAYTGASVGLAKVVEGLSVAPIVVILGMMLVVLVMGCFMESISIMMVTLPVFVPILASLHFNLIWFAVIMLINVEMGTISPPFGLGLYVMKGVAPAGTTMGDVYSASLPFIILDIIAIAIIMGFPSIALWLPNTMG